MPLIEASSYAARWPFTNAHLNTILPNRLRKPAAPAYTRQRLATPDGDFVDIDTCISGSDTLMVLLHGLEGNSERQYMRGMVHAAHAKGWDAVAMNHRGCSGETNRLYSAYHSGKTDDLDLVLNHAIAAFQPKRVFVVGFSLGGNVTLKYAGEKGTGIDERVRGVAALSVPCNLAASAAHLSRPGNRIYLHRFLKSLKAKAAQKKQRFPDAPFDLTTLNKAADFQAYDDLYTAPAHGFRDAQHYWQTCSSERYLSAIAVPALIINAADDPFLAPECYPVEQAKSLSTVFLEMPKHGGHVGFVNGWSMRGPLWHETRITEWLETTCASA